MNGIDDCLDNSDEINPNTTKAVQMKKSLKKFILTNYSIPVKDVQRNFSKENWEPDINGTNFLKFLSELSHQKHDIVSE